MIGPMSPPSAVLDTNTVLDWLVFRDPATEQLSRHIEAGRLAWRAGLSPRSCRST